MSQLVYYIVLAILLFGTYAVLTILKVELTITRRVIIGFCFAIIAFTLERMIS